MRLFGWPGSPVLADCNVYRHVFIDAGCCAGFRCSYIVMARIVMAILHRLSLQLYSYGMYRYGPYSCGHCTQAFAAAQDALAEARLKQEVAAAEAHTSRCCAETAQARSELALMKTKMRGVLLRVAADAPTKQKLFEWLESAGVSSSEAEWMTGELRAESWQHLHTHFTMVAEQNAQLTQEVAELKAKLQSDEQQQPCTAVAETKVQSEE